MVKSEPMKQEVSRTVILPLTKQVIIICLGMELFSSRRWRLYQPKQKAVVFMLNPKTFNQHVNGIIPYIHVWLLGRSSCSTKELHGLGSYFDGDLFEVLKQSASDRAPQWNVAPHQARCLYNYKLHLQQLTVLGVPP